MTLKEKLVRLQQEHQRLVAAVYEHRARVLSRPHFQLYEALGSRFSRAALRKHGAEMGFDEGEERRAMRVFMRFGLVRRSTMSNLYEKPAWARRDDTVYE